MRLEQEIFNDLEAICREEGFLEVIAGLCWKDNFIHIESEHPQVDDLLKTYSPEKLSRTELSTLIGLACKNDVQIKHLPLNEMITKAEVTINLMKDLHQSFYNGVDFSLDSLHDPNFFQKSQFMREAIFYGGDGCYKHQYRDLAKIRYQNDYDWLETNKKFNVIQAAKVLEAIDSLQLHKANTVLPHKNSFLEIFTFTIEEISSISNLNRDIIQYIVDAFSSLPTEGMECFNSVDDFNYKNAFPIIKISENSYVSFQSYSLWESLYESPFFWFGADKQYKSIASKNRGEFTENFTAQRLVQVFGKENVYTNIDIYRGKVRVGEIDILVVSGKFALVIQAKSKKLTIEARKGNSQQLKNDFKKAIQDSYDQAFLCSELLFDNSLEFRIASQKIELSNQYNTIIPISIVSDYYPALAMQSREFLKFNTTDLITAPYVIDVFQIDLMAEMLSTPLMFLDYLLKRIKYMPSLLINHELVALATYIKRNLYFDNQYNLVMLDDSISAEMECAMLARREGLEFAVIPEGMLKIKEKYKNISRLLSQLENSQIESEQQLGFQLLALHEETLSQLDQLLGKMKVSYSLGKEHSDASFPFENDKSGITFHMNNIDGLIGHQKLKNHVELRKYSFKANKWVGVSINPENLALNFVIYSSKEWEESEEMEVLISKQPIRPIRMDDLFSGAVERIEPSRSRFGRNSLCPCGSQKKFKKCCMENF